MPDLGVPSRTLPVHNAVKDVFMPALSSTMTEGKIVSWLKREGDKVCVSCSCRDHVQGANGLWLA